MVTAETIKLIQSEIEEAKKTIKSDRLSMSIGEVLSKIENKEIDLRPKFQRFFRWDKYQQSNLIESIFMGLPIPSIFVSTVQSGIWEVVDGLQRLNTIWSFYKNERNIPEGNTEDFILCRGDYIKSWDGLKYSDLSETQQLTFRNKRLDFVILDETSNPDAKYDMFKRLNTGGSNLSYQEIRNCLMIMKDESFYDWFANLGNDTNFKALVSNLFSERNVNEQKDLELVLVFLAMRNYPEFSLSNKDTNVFLDEQSISMAADKNYSRSENEKAFKDTFELLSILGENAFKRFDFNKNKYTGPLNFGIYDFLVSGIGANILLWDQNTKDNVKNNLETKLKELYMSDHFTEKIFKAGLTSSSRRKNAIELSKDVFDATGIK